jgi:6-phosphogluconolactonase
MTYKRILVIVLFLSLIPVQQAQKILLFIGTYTEGVPGNGIYIYEFNSVTGALKRTGAGENLTNPSFITLSPNGSFLYACTESKLPGRGSVSAFRIDSMTGKILLINKQSSGGENPVYVSVSGHNDFVVNGNYTDGNVTVYKVNNDGGLQPYTQRIQFADSSVNKPRQDQAHIHATIFSPGNDFVFVTDLGSDKIRAFKFDSTNSQPLIQDDRYLVKTSPGSGPRHAVFHPSAQFVYSIEELSGTVSGYQYADGQWDSIQRINSYSGKLDPLASADIHISPDGLFLYTSNRGRKENTISIFSINQIDGKLKLIGHQKTFGIHPRNFVIDPTGQFLLVANLETNNIVVFKRDMKTGFLLKTKHEIYVPRPSCLHMRNYHVTK